jgi:hypothetical protein
VANKKRSCYVPAMAVRTCRVWCRDLAGIEHTVEVTASSLFEAVAQALRIFRENEWVEIGHGQTLLVIRVKQPEIEHQVRIKDFEQWLNSNARSPADMALKSRLRALLES